MRDSWVFTNWSRWVDLNHQPAVYKTAALPIEPQRHKSSRGPRAPRRRGLRGSVIPRGFDTPLSWGAYLPKGDYQYAGRDLHPAYLFARSCGTAWTAGI